ncbi:MAG: hydrolase [Peptococcaceae bacterium]|nr:hydrolase [Peptococcaceae bacterium]
MELNFTREQALELLKKYNKEPFHLEHAYTLEGVMGWYARELGYGEDEAFWRMAGLLHDIDFEVYPEEHCKRAPELLAELNAGEELVHAVCSHAYGICSDVEPTHQMEKVLFAVDELTGLIGAGVLMRPSKTVMDMEADSVKRKFKDKHFAAGCSRDIIRTGAERLGWELNDLFTKTILAMRDCEASVREQMAALKGE